MIANSFEDRWLNHSGYGYQYRIMRHPHPEFAPTLFVGGAFMTMESWGRFAKRFAPHTTVVLIDPPGIGRSDFLPAEFRPQFLSECLAQVIEVHNLRRVNVISFSYGTPAAFGLAQQYPSYVDRVVLGGTADKFSERIVHDATVRNHIHSTVGFALQRDRDRLAEFAIGGLLNRRDSTADVDRQGLAERVLRSNIGQMSDGELERYAANTLRLLTHGCVDLSAPVCGPEALVFTGEYDDFTRPSDCLIVANCFKRARFTLVRRADHLFNIEQFETVVQLLLWFVRGTNQAPPIGCTSVQQVGHQTCAA
jgi:pimeloyl-ACP methyl ester carboxylesterase